MRCRSNIRGGGETNSGEVYLEDVLGLGFATGKGPVLNTLTCLSWSVGGCEGWFADGLSNTMFGSSRVDVSYPSLAQL